jgi:hypothetical protein
MTSVTENLVAAAIDSAEDFRDSLDELVENSATDPSAPFVPDRRAMLGEQTFEGRKENLSQANKLSRTYGSLLEALNRHRGKGQQKVTVEHVHVHSGGQAIVGHVEHPAWDHIDQDLPKFDKMPPM